MSTHPDEKSCGRYHSGLPPSRFQPVAGPGLRRQISATAIMAIVGTIGTLGGCATATRFVGISPGEFASAKFIMIPPVAQDRIYQCGYASLSSVARYYGVEPEALSDQALVDRYGGRHLSGVELVAMADHLGLAAFAYAGDAEDLKRNVQRGRPVLVLLNEPPRVGLYPSWEWAAETVNQLHSDPHWVVVSGVARDTYMLIYDPRRGYLAMKTGVLMSSWGRRDNACVLLGRIGDEDM